MINIKKIMLVILFLLTFNLNSFAAPYYYFPKQYIITIKNTNKKEIKNIELLYNSGIGFNYESNNRFRSWLNNTDFGYKYKKYSDKEIIPQLDSQQIDKIAFLYVHKDASSVKGYWLDNSVINSNTSIAKFAIYEKANIKYFKDKIIISYTGNDNKDIYPNGIILRITKKDNTILYSNQIYSSQIGLIDEFSKPDDIEKAKKVTTITAHFETDLSGINNKFDITEIF